MRLGNTDKCLAYLKGDGWLTEKLEEIFGTEDIEKSIGRRIDMVRKNANVLNLHLSDALKYDLQ